MGKFEVKFTKEPRNGLIALWADDRNIWDLPEKDCTPEVLRAIQSAVGRGAELYRDSVVRELKDIGRVTCGGEFESRTP